MDLNTAQRIEALEKKIEESAEVLPKQIEKNKKELSGASLTNALNLTREQLTIAKTWEGATTSLECEMLDKKPNQE